MTEEIIIKDKADDAPIEEVTLDNLSTLVKQELATLGKEKAKIVGTHLSMAYTFLESMPERSLLEAKKAVEIASRLATVREILGISAYKSGDYKLAIRELKTARRINNSSEYLPLIADSYRGIGEPERVFQIATSTDAMALKPDAYIEMSIVLAGAYADLGKFDAAQNTLTHALARNGLSTEQRLRLTEAKGTFFEQEGKENDAQRIWKVTEPIRAKIDYTGYDPLVVYDLEDLGKEA